jgi:hypothetical protein
VRTVSDIRHIAVKTEGAHRVTMPLSALFDASCHDGVIARFAGILRSHYDNTDATIHDQALGSMV